MVRLILRLLGIKDYEVCQSCETLKQQLELSNQTNKELTETLLSLIQPKIHQAPPVVMPQQTLAATTFTRRRAELEKADKLKAQIIKDSPFIAKPKDIVPSNELDKVEQLEHQLGLEEEKNA